jgi:dUTP pyrophosphatase
VKRVAVQVMRLAHNQDLELPAYQTEHSAGLDLPAALDSSLTMQPGDISLIPTGLALAIPKAMRAR